jgi:hypothetical protein
MTPALQQPIGSTVYQFAAVEVVRGAGARYLAPSQ